MVDARSEPEYESRAHTTTRRSMVTLAARRFSKVRPYSYADARLETRHAQLVPDLPLRLCGAWLTRGPDRILTLRPQAPRPSCCSYAAALTTDGQPAGTKNRRALVIAGDDQGAKATVTRLLDQFGFDTVDAGPLPGGVAYPARYSRIRPASHGGGPA